MKNQLSPAMRDVVSSPVKVWEAFNTLAEYGVDSRRLAILISKRVRPSGRPSKADEDARLLWEVSEYQKGNDSISDEKAIEAILRRVAERQIWMEPLTTPSKMHALSKQDARRWLTEYCARRDVRADELVTTHLQRLKTRLSRYKRVVPRFISAPATNSTDDSNPKL